MIECACQVEEGTTFLCHFHSRERELQAARQASFDAKATLEAAKQRLADYLAGERQSGHEPPHFQIARGMNRQRLLYEVEMARALRLRAGRVAEQLVLAWIRDFT